MRALCSEKYTFAISGISLTMGVLWMSRQGFIKNSAILLVTIAVTKILGMIYKVPLTMLLGGEGMGHLSAAMSVFMPVFAAVVSGITPAVARLTAENRALGRYANMRKTRRVSLRLFSLISAAGCIVLAGAAALFGRLTGQTDNALAVMCAVPTLLFCSVAAVEKGYHEGLSDMVPTAVSEMTESAFRLMLGLGFGYASGHILGLPIGLCAAAAVLAMSAASMLGSAVLFIHTAKKGDGVTKAQLGADPVCDSAAHMTGRLLACAVPIAFTSLVNTLTGLIDLIAIPGGLRLAEKASPHLFDRLTAGGVSPGSVPTFVYGSYTALALTVYAIVPTLTSMLSKSLLPEITAAFSAKDECRLSRSLSRLVTAAALISMPVGAVITACPKAVLGFIFGSRTLEIYVCERPFMILGPAAVCSGISAPCFSALLLLERPAAGIRIMLVSCAVKLVLDLVLIPQPALGISAAAISTAVSSLYILAACFFRLRRLTKKTFSPFRLLIKPFYAAVLCLAAAFICAKTVNLYADSVFTGRFGVLLTAGVSGGIYIISLVLLCEMPKNCFAPLNFKKKRKRT